MSIHSHPSPPPHIKARVNLPLWRKLPLPEMYKWIQLYIELTAFSTLYILHFSRTLLCAINFCHKKQLVHSAVQCGVLCLCRFMQFTGCDEPVQHSHWPEHAIDWLP